MSKEVKTSKDIDITEIAQSFSFGDTPHGWEDCLKYAEEYSNKDSKDGRGATVWIDKDLKATLDKIKESGVCKVPTTHLVSAILRTFFEEYKGEIVTAMKTSKAKKETKGKSLL